MKKIIAGLATGLVVAVIGWNFLVPQDWKNSISRKSLEHGGGHFLVTFANDGVVKTWDVNGKITCESKKGYYYFWKTVDGKKKYVQSPISKTFYEEK